MGFAPYHMGNLSLRLPRGRFLVTPTATSKAAVGPGDLLIVDGDGKVMEGRRKPFGELDLHLVCYRARPDAGAVVHGHPPAASAFAAVGRALELGIEPEAVVALGQEVPVAPFALPRAPEGAERVAQLAAAGDALLIQGNGAITLGTDLEMAMLRMELLEHAARVRRDAQALGAPRSLASGELLPLLEARRKAGLGPPPASPDDGLARAVAERLAGLAPPEVLERLVREEIARRR
jgi:L-fuculose-phosphate aldolase